MRIAGVASAFPKQYFSQAEITAALKQRWADKLENPAVLECLLSAGALQLPAGALDASWESLRKVGNLSSASVLLVLEDFMNGRRPAADSYGLLAAMGPGFCSELVLLRW